MFIQNTAPDAQSKGWGGGGGGGTRKATIFFSASKIAKSYKSWIMWCPPPPLPHFKMDLRPWLILGLAMINKNKKI